MQNSLIQAALHDALSTLKSRPAHAAALSSTRELALATTVPSLAACLAELAALDAAGTGLLADVSRSLRLAPGEALESKLCGALRKGLAAGSAKGACHALRSEE